MALLRESRLPEEIYDRFIGRPEPFHEEPREVLRPVKVAQRPIDRQAKLLVPTAHRKSEQLVGKVACSGRRGFQTLRCARRRRGRPENRRRPRPRCPPGCSERPLRPTRPGRTGHRAERLRSTPSARLRPVVPVMAENLVRSRTVRAGEPRQIGRLVGCPCSKSRAAPAVRYGAARRAPVPLGRIGIEKETRSARSGSPEFALLSPDQPLVLHRSEPVAGLERYPFQRKVGTPECRFDLIRHQGAEGDRITGRLLPLSPKREGACIQPVTQLDRAPAHQCAPVSVRLRAVCQMPSGRARTSRSTTRPARFRKCEGHGECTSQTNFRSFTPTAAGRRRLQSAARGSPR